MVTLDRDVTQCAYFATVTSVDQGTFGNRIAVVNDTPNPNQLQVSIGLSDDDPGTFRSINSGFSLAIVCP